MLSLLGYCIKTQIKETAYSLSLFSIILVLKVQARLSLLHFYFTPLEYLTSHIN